MFETGLHIYNSLVLQRVLKLYWYKSICYHNIFHVFCTDGELHAVRKKRNARHRGIRHKFDRSYFCLTRQLTVFWRYELLCLSDTEGIFVIKDESCFIIRKKTNHSLYHKLIQETNLKFIDTLLPVYHKYINYWQNVHWNATEYLKGFFLNIIFFKGINYNKYSIKLMEFTYFVLRRKHSMFKNIISKNYKVISRQTKYKHYVRKDIL